MDEIKKLRVRYNNEWPNRFLFPVEQQLKRRLDENNIQQAFIPAALEYTDNHEFHSLLAHLLDGIDQLPFRPDLAFDAIWRPLDAEFEKIKEETVQDQHVSRFTAFQGEMLADSNTCGAFFPLIEVIPLQTCEFVAKRILNHKTAPDKFSDRFLTRVRGCLGGELYADFIDKYESQWNTRSEGTQRQSGSFLLKLMKGDEMRINSNVYRFSQNQSVKFLISVVMPQYRNERFHGASLPPFRSSVAKLKTYAHAYYLFLVAYGILLEVFLYREFGVLNKDDVADTIDKNKELFLKVFGNVIKK